PPIDSRIAGSSSMTMTVGITSGIVNARRDGRDAADARFLRRAGRCVAKCGPEDSDSATPERS
ncbi:MAG TPA: hypothetical protein VJ349_22235, partial [Stellaceae bacterium]|nr:hypothetical protein [Stellaceae bacterium]